MEVPGLVTVIVPESVPVLGMSILVIEPAPHVGVVADGATPLIVILELPPPVPK